MSKPHFPNPWPAPQQLWADPPWILSGTSVTAWFELDQEMIRSLVSPSFEPLCGDKGVITRLRFYEIDFVPRDGDANFKEKMRGFFKEAVLAFKGRFGNVDGEYSAFMWTDDDVYIGWGREIFGWPLIREEIVLTGPAWSDSSTEKTTCSVTSKDFKLSLHVDNHPGRLESLGKGPNWLTPRRVIFPSGDESDRHDLNIVRPTIIDPGEFFIHTGGVNFSIKQDSIIEGLKPLTDAVIHRHSNFTICVGDNVETISGIA